MVLPTAAEIPPSTKLVRKTSTLVSFSVRWWLAGEAMCATALEWLQ